MSQKKRKGFRKSVYSPIKRNTYLAITLYFVYRAQTNQDYVSNTWSLVGIIINLIYRLNCLYYLEVT